MRRDPASKPYDIERRSFEIIDTEIPPPRPFEGNLWEIARRCVHALGDVTIIDDLVLSEDALASGLSAIKSGCEIFTDTRMLAAGLVERRMRPLGIRVTSIMDLPGSVEGAKKAGITRAAWGMERLGAGMAGNIIAIGNAPTALLALIRQCERLPEAKPALIVGMPVGFVNADYSKEILLATGLPCFSLKGRKGGSAVTAAAINALAEIALRG